MSIAMTDLWSVYVSMDISCSVLH